MHGVLAAIAMYVKENIKIFNDAPSLHSLIDYPFRYWLKEAKCIPVFSNIIFKYYITMG